MNLDEIKSILQLMEANKLVEFEYEDDGRRLKLRRAEDRIVTTAIPLAMPARLPASAPAAPAAGVAPAEAARPSQRQRVQVALVGTFYRSGKPDSDPSSPSRGDRPEKVI